MKLTNTVVRFLEWYTSLSVWSKINGFLRRLLYGKNSDDFPFSEKELGVTSFDKSHRGRVVAKLGGLRGVKK